MSKPGDSFEMNIMTSIFYCEKAERIYINVEYERLNLVDIPFFFIFRMFDISSELEMM